MADATVRINLEVFLRGRDQIQRLQEALRQLAAVNLDFRQPAVGATRLREALSRGEGQVASFSQILRSLRQDLQVIGQQAERTGSQIANGLAGPLVTAAAAARELRTALGAVQNVRAPQVTATAGPSRASVQAEHGPTRADFDALERARALAAQVQQIRLQIERGQQALASGGTATSQQLQRYEALRERLAQVQIAQDRLARAYATGRISAEAYSTGLGRLAQQAATVQRGGRSLAAHLEDLATSSQTTASRLQAVGATLASIASAGFFSALTARIAALGGSFFSAAVQMDSLERALRVAAGSSDEAKKQLAELTEVARLPGIGFQEAIEGAANLQAVGISADVAIRALREFSNAVALSGGGREQLRGVIVQLGQLANAGKVLAQDLKPILQQAPAVGEALRAAFGTVRSEDIQALDISTQEFIERLLRALAALPRASAGARNAFDNLTDALFRTSAALGRTFVPALARLAEIGADVVERVTAAFTRLPQAVQTGAVALAALAAAVGPILGTLASLVTFVALLIGQFGGVEAVVAGLSTAVAAVGTGITGLVTAVGGLGPAVAIVATALAGLALLASQVAAGLTGLIITITGVARGFERVNFDQLTRALAQAAARVGQTAERVFTRVGRIAELAITTIAGVVERGLTVIARFWAAHGDRLTAIVSTAWAAIEGVVNAALDVVEGAVRTAAAIIEGDWARAWAAAVATLDRFLVDARRVIGRLVPIVAALMASIVSVVQAGLALITAAVLAWALSLDVQIRLTVARAITEAGRHLGEAFVASLVDAITLGIPRAIAEVRRLVAGMRSVPVEASPAQPGSPEQPGPQPAQGAAGARATRAAAASIESRESFAASERALAERRRVAESLRREGLISARALALEEERIQRESLNLALRRERELVAAAEKRAQASTDAAQRAAQAEVLAGRQRIDALEQQLQELDTRRAALDQAARVRARAETEAEFQLRQDEIERELRENDRFRELRLRGIKTFFAERERLQQEALNLEIARERARLEEAERERARALGRRRPDRAAAAQAEADATRSMARIIELERRRADITTENANAMAESLRRQKEELAELNQELARTVDEQVAASNVRIDLRFLEQLERAQAELGSALGRLRDIAPDQAAARAAASAEVEQAQAVRDRVKQRIEEAKLIAEAEIRRQRVGLAEAELSARLDAIQRAREQGLISENQQIELRLQTEREVIPVLSEQRDRLLEIFNITEDRSIIAPIIELSNKIARLGVLTPREEFERVRASLERLNAERIRQEQEVERSVEVGQRTERQGRLEILRVQAAYRAEVQATIAELKRLAEAAKDEDLKNLVADLEQQFRDLGDQIRAAQVTLNTQLETAAEGAADAILDALDKIPEGFGAVGRSLLDSVRRVLRDITRELLQSEIKKILQSLFKIDEQGTRRGLGFEIIEGLKRILGLGRRGGAAPAAPTVRLPDGQAPELETPLPQTEVIVDELGNVAIQIRDAITSTGQAVSDATQAGLGQVRDILGQVERGATLAPQSFCQCVSRKLGELPAQPVPNAPSALSGSLGALLGSVLGAPQGRGTAVTVRVLDPETGEALPGGETSGIFSRLEQFLGRLITGVQSALERVAGVIQAGVGRIGSAIGTLVGGASKWLLGLLGFAGGGFTGLTRGPGGPHDDLILARLSPGEFVHRHEAVRAAGLGVMEAINALSPANATAQVPVIIRALGARFGHLVRGVRGFAHGGLIPLDARWSGLEGVVAGGLPGIDPVLAREQLVLAQTAGLAGPAVSTQAAQAPGGDLFVGAFLTEEDMMRVADNPRFRDRLIVHFGRAPKRFKASLGIRG
jgi:tape measure domain-containing protein